MNKKLEIGKRIKFFGENNFSSVAELSRKLGMKNRQSLNPYLQGESFPGGELLSKLAELSCDINWLLIGDDNQINLVRENSGNYMTTAEIQKSNEDLKEENKQLKAEIYDLQRERSGLTKKITDLVRENELIQEELKKLSEGKT